MITIFVAMTGDSAVGTNHQQYIISQVFSTQMIDDSRTAEEEQSILNKFKVIRHIMIEGYSLSRAAISNRRLFRV